MYNKFILILFQVKSPIIYDTEKNGPLKIININEEPRKIETIKEIPSVTNYYDGTFNLNNKELECTILKVQNTCIKSGNCGWCIDTKLCISGNAYGPTNENLCRKERFIYAIKAA